MAPQMYGNPGEKPGEKLVYNALSRMPVDCLIYPQPMLVHRREVRYPDFVIVCQEWGVIVLEVKDWSQILERYPREARIRHLDGREEIDTSPVEQARVAAHVLESMLRQDEALCNYAGKLDFSYAYGGVLPHVPSSTVTWLEQEWGEGYVLGREDLDPDRLMHRVAGIPVPFRIRMQRRQMDAVRAILDSRNVRRNERTGEFKGVLDPVQESLAKEPVPDRAKRGEQREAEQPALQIELIPDADRRAEQLKTTSPQEVATLSTAQHVRLVRGFLGTGKTDVLVLRAHYLYEQYPEMQILVTTFNDPLYQERLKPELASLGERVDVIKCDTLCAGIYRKRHRQWVKPQDTFGLVTAMAEKHPLVNTFGAAFLADEFIWMKETGRTAREAYVDGVREGRGSASGRTLGRGLKEQVLDLFESYQEKLGELPAHDWVDLHEKALRYLEEGVEPEKRYDAILIDEAQHFAPKWVQIITHFLNPDGLLFLCDDPSQSVYRYYSWRQKGVEVVGRTRWLRVPYRNTRQIFQAAYALIADDSLARALLAENGETVQPNTDLELMREGPRPEVHLFPSAEAEREFVRTEVSELVRHGVLPGEIALLHEKKHVRSYFGPALPKGVRVDDLRRQTGLEYKAVFLPRMDEALQREVGLAWEEDRARQCLKFYMAMGRARDRLHLSARGRWPKELDAVRPHVEWVEH